MSLRVSFHGVNYKHKADSNSRRLEEEGQTAGLKSPAGLVKRKRFIHRNHGCWQKQEHCGVTNICACGVNGMDENEKRI